MEQDAQVVADHIVQAFVAFHESFKSITLRARTRFETRDWASSQIDSVERLEVYRNVVKGCVGQLRSSLADAVQDKNAWSGIKQHYSRCIEGRPDLELAETFFNSVTRRIFSTVGVDPQVQYVDSDFDRHGEFQAQDLCHTYEPGPTLADLLERILLDTQFQVPFEDLKRDTALAAPRVQEALQGKRLLRAEVLRPIFYRNKGAYVIGRLLCEDEVVPLALPLLHLNGGIILDAVLMEQNEVSIVFSFTRSYFFIRTHNPREIVEFLLTIMPNKPRNELYNSLGYNKHGKTLLYRELIRHLSQSDDQFVVARGERGMVMLVFTLPSFDVVFKVIKDTFDYPKTTTRQQVMQKYDLVFTHDRAGRLVDAQQLEFLQIPRNRFAPDLLAELQHNATFSLRVEGDDLILLHLYTERRLTPLNLFLQEAPHETALDAVVDYGNAIKDMVNANIFPGDLLLKNFGVTRHGRVIFYDYDELCLITECNFRRIPEPRSIAEELAAEPWYEIAENDIFPEELQYFMGLQGDLRDTYYKAHGDLFEVDFWLSTQKRLRTGYVADIYPYKQSRRLHTNGVPPAS